MSVYYKFNSELNYSHVDFDGLHIAVSDLKKAILHQKRLGKTADFDLLVSTLVDSSAIKWFSYSSFGFSLHNRYRTLKQKKSTETSSV